MPAPDNPSRQHGVRVVPAYFIPGAGQVPLRENCPVVEEAMLTIDVAAVGWFALMWTPTASLHEVLGYSLDLGVLAATDDPEVLALTAGFLFTEGLIRSLADVRRMEVCGNDPGIVRVELVDPQRVSPRRKDVTLASSCGVCGGREAVDRLVEGLVPVADTMRLGSGQFVQLMAEMRALQTVFNQTGGAHGAAVFDRTAGIVAVAEDLGRHNALDKVIGMCLLRQIDLSGCGVLLSSRLSLEMITKAIRAGFEIIAAVSAPTSLAIEIGERFGVTLGGFVRGGRATIYSRPQRIAELVALQAPEAGGADPRP